MQKAMMQSKKNWSRHELLFLFSSYQPHYVELDLCSLKICYTCVKESFVYWRHGKLSRVLNQLSNPSSCCFSIDQCFFECIIMPCRIAGKCNISSWSVVSRTKSPLERIPVFVGSVESSVFEDGSGDDCCVMTASAICKWCVNTSLIISTSLSATALAVLRVWDLSLLGVKTQLAHLWGPLQSSGS